MNGSVLITIGDHIKKIRESRGLNQETFAANADISVSYLSEIENGRKNPRITILYKICTGNDISADELLFGHEDELDIIEMIYNNSDKLTIHDIDIITDYLKGLRSILENRENK